MMIRLGILWLLVGLSGIYAEGGRPYFNDLKAPETREDVMAIQAALQKSLGKARAATVSIDLGGGAGSGVIVSEDGLILTAAHVAQGVKKKITVIMEDGTKYPAVTMGVISDTDAAMAKITVPGKYPFVPWDQKGTSRLGDWVFALGHSGGFEQARGSVVRLGRIVRVAQDTVQTDCILIGGDSGGPLFDIEGTLIGIHSRVGHKLPENMHVPMHVFKEHWQEMLESKFVGNGPFAQPPVKGNGYLGLGTEARTEGGLKVTKVGKESPAEVAGIKVGDVLIKMNDQELKTREQLQGILKELVVGDSVVFLVEREGKKETITIEVSER